MGIIFTFRHHIPSRMRSDIKDECGTRLSALHFLFSRSLIFSIVIARLDPAIHVRSVIELLGPASQAASHDGPPVKPGGDEERRCLFAARTRPSLALPRTVL
jgi:hypothetical protein